MMSSDFANFWQKHSGNNLKQKRMQPTTLGMHGIYFQHYVLAYGLENVRANLVYLRSFVFELGICTRQTDEQTDS